MRSVVAPLAFLFALTAGCGGDGGSLALLSADGTYVVSFARATKP
jgi:hypothetical protein